MQTSEYEVIIIGAGPTGLHARSLELLDQRGIVDRFLAQGKTHRA